MNYLCGLCESTFGAYTELEKHRVVEHGPKVAIALRNEGRLKDI